MAKKNKRNDSYLSIRKKLIAAVAMLLVASFMVASSSYAWFTLSTAPEVTGIQTSVGANGSLEIALYNGTDPTSSVGDGNLSAVQKNITWGNQINLSDESYGLNKIILNPSRLNYKGGKINSAPLLTPEYAVDGRVKSLEANTVFGVYDTAEQGFASSDNAYGVRAIGTVSGMTDQETDWRNARSAIGTALLTAYTKAKDSLDTNANALASMAIQKATNATEFDISFVPAMVTALNEANAEIGNAIVAYVQGAAAQAYADESDYSTTYRTQLALLQINNVSIANGKITITAGDFSREITLPNTSEAEQKVVSDLAAIYAIYNKNATTLTTVNNELAKVDGATYKLDAMEWSNASADVPTVTSILIPLVNVEEITVNDIPSTNLMDNLGKLVSAVASGITVALPGDAPATADDESAGIYPDIADVCGNGDIVVDAIITVPPGTYGGVPIDQEVALSSTMRTVTTKQYQLKALLGDTAPDTENSGNTKMTDYYGYIIDLAFRTNAKDSSLMLQTTPVDRIDSSGNTEETMGGGSNMTFTITDPDFSIDNAKNLLKAIRIVFVDDTNSIIALGGLDADNVDGAAGNAFKANIYLYEYSIEEQDNGGSIIKPTALKDPLKQGDQPITSLEQNGIEIVHVYVYLDGDEIDNGDVANAAESIAGTINLQFSSSEELVPMDYTFSDVVGPEGKTPVTLEESQIVAGSTVTIATKNTLTLPGTVGGVDAQWAVVGDYATLDGNTLTPSGAGTVTLKCTTASGTTEFFVKIIEDVTDITLTNASLEIVQGSTLDLSATVAPSNATNKTITWSTTEIAEGFAINASGKVTTTAATPAGDYTVTATIANGTATGAYTKNFTVTVVAATPAP